MSRFIRIGSAGEQLAPGAPGCVALLDPISRRMWSAEDVTPKAVDYKAAEKACNSLQLAGASDWRMPTVEESFVLADRTRYAPAIDIEAFPTCKSEAYWSSSSLADDPKVYAWVVHFLYGHSYDYHRSGRARVRAVRVAGVPGQ